LLRRCCYQAWLSSDDQQKWTLESYRVHVLFLGHEVDLLLFLYLYLELAQ